MVQKSSSWEEVRMRFADCSQKNENQILIVARQLIDTMPVHKRTCRSQMDSKYGHFRWFSGRGC